MTAGLVADHTHDQRLRSWVESANAPGTDFPIQNLPFGTAASSAPDGSSPVVAIGEYALDLRVAADAGVLAGAGEVLGPDTTVDTLLAAPPENLRRLRHCLVEALASGSDQEPILRGTPGALVPIAELRLLTPARIGSFTDFYAGIHHARAASRILLRGEISENYQWVPIGYQSRASSVRASGMPIPRPNGQLPGPGGPRFGACERLDFELEIGIHVGTATCLGEPVDISAAADHIAGYSLLNDWSARDIQRWEMTPLGPFLSKNFATTVSPWIVTADALAPFRVPAMPRGDGEPEPLAYLHDPEDQAAGGLGVALDVWISTARMRAEGEPRAHLLHSDARHLYWTPAQLLAHHTCGGCDLQTGDLLGTGTISGPQPDQLGSLLELTEDARAPVTLPNGETRGYLRDGDEITFTGRCARDGYVPIGFGECTGVIVAGPALATHQNRGGLAHADH